MSPGESRHVQTPSNLTIRSFHAPRGPISLAVERASLWYVVNGQMDDATNGSRETLVRGDLLYHPAGSQHRRIVQRGPLQAVVIELPPTLLSNFCAIYDRCPRSIRSSNAALNGLPERMVMELERDDAAAPYALEALVLQMLAEGARSDTAPRRRRPPLWLPRAIAYIESATDHRVTSAEVAAVVGRTERLVRDVFRRYVGKKVSDVSLDVRMRAASEMLRANVAISQIASDLGFYDQSHMTRLFKKQSFSTPHQWRKRRFDD